MAFKDELLKIAHSIDELVAELKNEATAAPASASFELPKVAQDLKKKAEENFKKVAEDKRKSMNIGSLGGKPQEADPLLSFIMS